MRTAVVAILFVALIATVFARGSGSSSGRSSSSGSSRGYGGSRSYGSSRSSYGRSSSYSRPSSRSYSRTPTRSYGNYGRSSYGRQSYSRQSYGRQSYGRVNQRSYGRQSYGRNSYGRVSQRSNARANQNRRSYGRPSYGRVSQNRRQSYGRVNQRSYRGVSARPKTAPRPRTAPRPNSVPRPRARPENLRPATRPAAPTGPAPSGLGSISAKYESAKTGVSTISTGRKDPGGVSYGAHQLASKTGTMSSFLNSPEGRSFKSGYFGNMKPGTSQFNAAYAKAAAEQPKAFAKAQKDYITRTHYNPVANTATQAGFNTKSRKVQEALYSMSVQHGRAKSIVGQAAKSLPANASVEQQVKALYDARSKYVSKLDMPASTRKSVLDRYKNEVRDVMRMDE